MLDGFRVSGLMDQKNSCPLIRRVNGFPRLEWKNLQLRDVRGGDDEALKKR